MAEPLTYITDGQLPSMPRSLHFDSVTRRVLVVTNDAQLRSFDLRTGAQYCDVDLGKDLGEPGGNPMSVRRGVIDEANRRLYVPFQTRVDWRTWPVDMPYTANMTQQEIDIIRQDLVRDDIEYLELPQYVIEVDLDEAITGSTASGCFP